MEITKLSLDSSKKALNIIHYKFNGNNDDYIYTFLIQMLIVTVMTKM